MVVGHYPNPSTLSDISVEIEAFAELTVSIQVVSTVGREMTTRSDVQLQQGLNRIEVAMSEIAVSGTYWLVIESPHGYKSVPLNIQR